MNEDDLLEGLGARARQRWSEQTAALDGDSVEGWTPLTEQEQADVIDGVLAHLDAESASPDSPIALRSAQASAPPPSVEPAANEAPRRSAVVALFGLGVALAVAAAVVLWRSSAPTVTALPDYDDAGFEAGTAVVRGHDPVPSEVPRLRAEGELRWRLRPQTTVEQTVGLRLLAEGAQRHCLAPDAVKVSPQGAIELHGTVSEILPLAPGAWTLTPIVGQRSRLADSPDPCAWKAEGRAAPAGLSSGPPRRVILEADGR